MILILLSGVYQKVSFKQNLIIKPVNVFECMMVIHQINDSIYHVLRKSGTLIKLSCHRSSNFLLLDSGTRTEFRS